MQRTCYPGSAASLFRGGDQGSGKGPHSQRWEERHQVLWGERQEGSSIRGDENESQGAGATCLSRITFSLDSGHKFVTRGRLFLWVGQTNPVFPSWPVRQPQLAAGRGLINGPITLDPELVRSLRSSGWNRRGRQQPGWEERRAFLLEACPCVVKT